MGNAIPASQSLHPTEPSSFGPTLLDLDTVLGFVP